ncbi:MBL fold metallo-hydrolase [Isachenkonia alkalipeptolytica]|uniref:MBL fold metallo-hydrolase n=1 Tax=Isachenkonia alkalipeptolytica TaxID=2565777 RepID=A0AA43XJ98_9CLOT|nr:MBL fold metallo-hydrolase [Isachenkonia alkalipeptolytica]NBG87880.1 MBL fold metallo-hydrolase [Isachenkonia alkalipeptolytica]
MKLTVLVDNNTYIDQYCYGEPAVSYYIEDEDTKLLLDTGYSDVFLKNAKNLGVNLKNLNTIVITHGHDDHTGGLQYYFEHRKDLNFTVIAHPEAFHEKKKDGLRISAPINEEEVKDRCHLFLSKEPVQISANITFLGEIPQANSFEKREAMGEQILKGKAFDDFLLDDSALVYKREDGIYIITGCSHSGICNIIEYAKEVTKEERVLGVIGGFHLFEVNERVHRTIDYLKQNNIQELYACHCTSFEVKAEIHKVLPIKEVGVGLQLYW